MLRTPDTLVVHYTATYPDANPTWAEIDRWHKAAGSRGFGYHWYIDRNAKLFEGRPEDQMGAHARGYNDRSIGVCFAGGLDRKTGSNVGVWNPTEDQEQVLIEVIAAVLKRNPSIKHVVGHRNVSATQCPGRDDVSAWWEANKHRANKPVPIIVDAEVPLPVAGPKPDHPFIAFLKRLFGIK